ncbi:MAG: hypothetical protein EOL87_07690 [Spartobacteria bacterium]|nr:hypothetical protein [Spartobacteria bacterium]
MKTQDMASIRKDLIDTLGQSSTLPESLHSPDETSEDWQWAVATELLLHQACGGAVSSQTYWPSWRTVRPFGEAAPTLEQLAVGPCAVALFPMATSPDYPPEIAQLWLVTLHAEPGSDQRHMAEGLSEWMKRHGDDL